MRVPIQSEKLEALLPSAQHLTTCSDILSVFVQLEEGRQQEEAPSEEERLRMAAANAIRNKAAAARLEATDEAKRMNQMVLYSKCMAVRCGPSLLAPAEPLQPCVCRRDLMKPVR